MFRPLLYLEIGDIDEAFENLLSNLPGVGNENRKIQQFVHYLRSTWIGTGPGKDTKVLTNAMFDRSVWNLHEYLTYRTTNIAETYNKRLNDKISKPDPIIYNLIDVVKGEETLKAVEFEKANLGKKKPRRTKNELKDAKITILKLKYSSGEMEMMDLLKECSQILKEFD